MSEQVKWDLTSKTQLANALAILLPLLSVKLGVITPEQITAVLVLLDMSQEELIYAGGALLAAMNMVLRKFTKTKTSILPPKLRK